MLCAGLLKEQGCAAGFKTCRSGVHADWDEPFRLNVALGSTSHRTAQGLR